MTCVTCNKAIWEESIQAGGKTYHPECFKCAKCKSQIKGQFFSEPVGPVCPACSPPTTDKRCAKCNCFLEGEFRMFKGRNYCHKCSDEMQKAELDARKNQYGAVVSEEHRVAEQNKRLHNAPKGDPKRFDYKERMQWEKEEREKMGIPESERKW